MVAVRLKWSVLFATTVFQANLGMWWPLPQWLSVTPQILHLLAPSLIPSLGWLFCHDLYSESPCFTPCWPSDRHTHPQWLTSFWVPVKHTKWFTDLFHPHREGEDKQVNSLTPIPPKHTVLPLLLYCDPHIGSGHTSQNSRRTEASPDPSEISTHIQPEFLSWERRRKAQSPTLTSQL